MWSLTPDTASFTSHNLTFDKSALTQTSAKPQAVLIHDGITIPQQTTRTITAYVDRVSEWNTTGTVTPEEAENSQKPRVLYYPIQCQQ